MCYPVDGASCVTNWLGQDMNEERSETYDGTDCVSWRSGASGEFQRPVAIRGDYGSDHLGARSGSGTAK